MKLGMLYPYKKEKQKDFDEGKAVAGIDASSLLDSINNLEVKHAYNTSMVLGELKYALLQILGKAQEFSEEGKGGDDGVDGQSKD